MATEDRQAYRARDTYSTVRRSQQAPRRGLHATEGFRTTLISLKTSLVHHFVVPRLSLQHVSYIAAQF